MHESKPMLWPRDGWYAVLVIDQFSVPITLRLAQTKITPNQVTIIAIVFKVIAVSLIWFEQPWLSFIFWQIGFLFDCVDGPLARLTKQFSPYGELLDHGSDILMQWAYTLSVAFKVLFPDMLIIFFLTILWTALWMVNWLIVERQEDNIVSSGSPSINRNPYFQRYKQWTGSHRLKLTPVTGIEEMNLIFPLAYALGWLSFVVPILVVYRLLALGIRLFKNPKISQS